MNAPIHRRAGVWLGVAALAVTALVAIVAYRLNYQPLASTQATESTGEVKEGGNNRAPSASIDTGRETAPDPAMTLAQFADVAERMGVEFDYVRGETGAFWPVEPVGGGAGWIDTDGNGWLDLVLVGGKQLPVDPAERFISTRLFRNVAGARFEDITELAGLVSHDYGQGCAIADYDNDGADDVYVTNYGRSALYRNNGDGTFAEVTDDAGVPGGEWNTGACFSDLNRDGILDLYVAGYFHFKQEGYQSCRSAKGVHEYCGPSDAPPLPDYLYQGRGDGTFEDVSSALGAARDPGPGFGGVAADLDNDGWPELYVANDAWANFLFRNCSKDQNDGAIHLEEVAHEWGAAVNADGVPQASMGLACADFDRNGFLDIAVTNFNLEYTTLYSNNGDQFFVDSSHRLGLVAISHTTVGWGLVFVDYDNDGWLDLFVANGHINHFENDSPPYEMKPHLLYNDRGKRFRDIGARAGEYFSRPVIGRGVALGDFDQDGRADLAVVHHHRPATLLRNETRTEHGSVTFQFVGKASNRTGLNTRLRIWLTPELPDQEEPTMIVRELVSGDSYMSANAATIQVGVGKGEILHGEIQWPSGQVQAFGLLAAGTRWRLYEGTSAEAQMVSLSSE